jgi:hypothetical protein
MVVLVANPHKYEGKVMRCLAKAQSHEVRAKVDAVWNGK